MKIVIVILISSLLAAGRIDGLKGELFQAVAHLWEGILIGAWLAGAGRFYLGTWVILALVELVAFLVTRTS